MIRIEFLNKNYIWHRKNGSSIIWEDGKKSYYIEGIFKNIK